MCSSDLAYRAAVGISFVAAFTLMWGSLVQMTDVNPAAGLYFLVPVVGIVGAIVARLRPGGMARALLVTALAQCTVWVCVLIAAMARKTDLAAWTPPELRGYIGNAVTALLFTISAVLFHRASRGEAPAIAA